MKTIIQDLLNEIDKKAFLFGCIGIALLIALDILLWDIPFLKDGQPVFSLPYLIRNVVVFISALAIVWSLINGSRPKFALSDKKGVSYERISIIVVLFLSVIILFLFLFETTTFNALSKEDKLIEWASAIFLFGSCFIMALSYIQSKHTNTILKMTRISIGLLALLFFIMAMEEISWFQRVIGIDTPELFAGNHQNEMNLHNYASNYTENLYYFGSYIFLVVLPFIRFISPSALKNINLFNVLAPRPFLAIIGAIACAYNYDMWNIVFTQITFFGSLIILCVFVYFNASKIDLLLVLFTILLGVMSQLLFLVYGTNFDRTWEITEYKEFLIPLALLIYSWDVFMHLRTVPLNNKSKPIV